MARRRAAESGVLVEIEGARIAAVEAGVAEPPAGATRLERADAPRAGERPLTRLPPGPSRPGPAPRRQLLDLARGHVRGRLRVDPDGYRRLARATFAEMALAGITAVGEFHYLHHGPGGEPYANPNEVGKALIEAAGEAGIRITLLDTCYLHGGHRRAAQRGPAALRGRGRRRLGRIASTRCAAAERRADRRGDPQRPRLSTPTRRRWSRRGRRRATARCTPTSPSSRPRTRPASPPTAPARPRCSTRAGALSERFTAVHATHIDEADIAALGGARAAAVASARPPSATSPTGSARRGR